MANVVVGYVHPDLIHARFATSLFELLVHKGPNSIDAVLSEESGPLIATARNGIVRRFLDEQRAPWLLMVDTDMVFAADALDRLLNVADQRTAPIVGALCWSQTAAGDQPTLYELVPHEDGAAAFARYTTWPEDALMPVGGTGAAFLLIHRYVLEKIERGWAPGRRDVIWPWFRESAMGSRAMGEDLTFCLRVKSAGYPIHVDTGVQVGHLKTTMLGKVN